ncbi:MAG: RsmE family RNA methyltransferase [Eubacteriales bacterium]
MHRFFAKIEDGNVVFSPEEAAHMKVLRIKNGELIAALTDEGEYTLLVRDIIAGDFSILEKKEVKGVTVAVTLYQAYPKSDKMEDILKHGVELGVKHFRPFISKRCVKRPEDNLERLNKVLKGAVKQCGRGDMPDIAHIMSINEVADSIKKHDLAFVCYEGEKTASIKNILKEHAFARDIGIIIGPEGGFEEAEIKLFCENGARCVTLGKRILRTQTASLAAICAIMYEKGEMG